MSTYWYFECLSHTPALRSEEFTQHTGDRHYERAITLAESRPVEPDNRYWTLRGASDQESSDAYFEMHARAFLAQHPDCRLAVVNEHGERAPDIVGSVGVPMSRDEIANVVGRAAAWLENIRETTGHGDTSRRPSNYRRAANDLRQYAAGFREEA